MFAMDHLEFAGFHPLFVHFPLALLVIAALCDVLAVPFRRVQMFQNTALILAIFGTVTAFITMYTGSLAADRAVLAQAGRSLLHEHEELGEKLPWLALFALIVRLAIAKWKPENFLRHVSVLFSIGVAITVMILGHSGGELIYRYGTNTMPVIHNQTPAASTPATLSPPASTHDEASEPPQEH